MAPLDEEYWILVMGMTGSGKSTFINLLAEEKDRVRVGHSLNSTTAEVQDHAYRMADGGIVRLLDTPGFDDTNRSDTDVLQTIANAMNELYSLGWRIDGVIYMHPIIDPRMSGAALKSLGIFRRICGEQYFPHIALVSTKWESLKGKEARVAAECRETDLREKPEFWADLVDRGSMTFQHDGSVQSARNIVNNLLKRSQQASLQLQLEMRQGKTLAETEAGSFVEGEVLKMKENYEKEVERLKHEFKQMKVEGDLGEEESVLEQAKAVQAKIYGLKHDAASLHVDSRDLEELKGSHRRKSFAARDREKASSDDEQWKIAKEVEELRDQKIHLEYNIDDLKDEEAALLRRNKHLEQEEAAHRMMLTSRKGQLHLERRKQSPNEVQLSARHPRDEKRVNEFTRSTERDFKASEHGMRRGCTSPISPPAPPRHSRAIDSDFPERQASPPARGLRRAQTVPYKSTFEPQ
jgi:50S ribosome-binding GTPase